jgi:hypothetical protein
MERLVVNYPMDHWFSFCNLVVHTLEDRDHPLKWFHFELQGALDARGGNCVEKADWLSVEWEAR